jgi:hypothetical protein
MVVAVLGAAPPALAQQGAGIRGGVSADPDQFYVGAHYVTAPIVDRLRFQPNLEIGFGDDLTLVALNFEFAYWTRLNRDWQLYAGGGPAVNIYDFERRDDSDAEPGINLVVGFQQRKGLFFEFKVGVLDSPDIKLGVGYTF